MDLVLLVIILINVIVSLKGFNDTLFFEKYKFNIGSIRSGDHIRMISSAFLHADTMHLFFNMFTLYFFGPIITDILSDVKFLIIYFGSLLAGNIFSLLFHKDEYHYSAVGASGAISGIVYAAILFRPDMDLYLMFIPIPIPAYIFGICYLFYSIYGMKNKTDNIGHDAHFGGSVGGYLITLLFAPYIIDQHLTFVILLALPIVILFILIKTGKI